MNRQHLHVCVKEPRVKIRISGVARTGLDGRGPYRNTKTRVSELEVRYTVPEVKAGDGFVVIQTPFGKIIMDDSHFRVGQECGRVIRIMFKDPSQWVVVPVSAPFLPKRWNLECDAQGFLYGMPDRTGT